jgi:hypothetical protein
MNEEETVDYDKMSIIGDEAYQVLCISRKKERQRERLDEILADTVVSNEDYYLIKQGSRKRILTEYKFKFISAICDVSIFYKNIQEIGCYLNRFVYFSANYCLHKIPVIQWFSSSSDFM